MTIDVDGHLKECASAREEDIDLGNLSLIIMEQEHPGLSLDRYRVHFDKNSKSVLRRHKHLIENGAEDDAGTQLAALKYVITEENEYICDRDTMEALEMADMVRVIDRRAGGAVALAVLYIDAARKCGWDVRGVNFPGRYLCRLQKGAERLLFDPADPSKMLQAVDLRAMVKGALGDAAELSNAYLDAVDVRDTVMHLCNHISLRCIEMGDYENALQVIEKVHALRPDDYRLLLDTGVLYARTNQKEKAISTLRLYIDSAPLAEEKQEALNMLHELELSD